MKGLAQILPMMIGIKNTGTEVVRTQLEQLAKEGPKELQGVMKKFLNGTQDPRATLLFKVKSNYAIAGLQLRDGEKKSR